MSARSDATPLSLLFLFSIMTAGFSATAFGQDFIEGFTKPEQELALPATLVNCPGRQPQPLVDALIERAQGQPVLLHLWGTFCAPCREELPQIDKVASTLASQGLYVFTLAQEPQGSYSVPTFARRYGIESMDLCYEPTSKTLMTFKPQGLPATYLVMPDGTVSAVHEGTLDWAKLVNQTKPQPARKK